jgi:HK97 family phage major capsid protein
VTDYDNTIARDGSNDPLVPVPVAADIINGTIQSSAILQLARRVQMSSKTWRTPALSLLPTAYWVSGDQGLKKTSSADWENVTLTAEEIAVIVPIPEAYLADSQVPIWDEVRPLVAQAFAAKLDAACLFGADAPATFPSLGVYGQTLASGNVVVKGASSTTLAENIAGAGEEIAKDGYAVNGFAARPGFAWNLVGENVSGVPIYQPAQGGLPTSLPAQLYGYPFREVLAGGWDSGEAELIAGDWSKALVGVRQDLTFKVFTEGSITDTDGKVILNLMQQDSVALRAVMRVGFALARPVTALNSTATRSPFYSIQATTANS